MRLLLSATLAALACACGGATVDASPAPSPCGPEPGDPSAGCVATDAADIGVIRIQTVPMPAAGWVDIWGTAHDGDADREIELVLGNDAFATQTFALAPSDVFTNGVNALVITKTTCRPPPDGPGEHSPQCDLDPTQSDWAEASGGAVSCDADATRIACRFTNVPLASRGTDRVYHASGWLHVPR